MSDDASDNVRTGTDTSNDNSAADIHSTSMSSSPQRAVVVHLGTENESEDRQHQDGTCEC